MSGELLEDKELISFKGRVKGASFNVVTLINKELPNDFTSTDFSKYSAYVKGTSYISLTVEVLKKDIYTVQEQSESLLFF